MRSPWSRYSSSHPVRVHDQCLPTHNIGRFELPPSRLTCDNWSSPSLTASLRHTECTSSRHLVTFGHAHGLSICVHPGNASRHFLRLRLLTPIYNRFRELALNTLSYFELHLHLPAELRRCLSRMRTKRGNILKLLHPSLCLYCCLPTRWISTAITRLLLHSTVYCPNFKSVKL
jgi:hypothetical protein